jgi:hypothetical protein
MANGYVTIKSKKLQEDYKEFMENITNMYYCEAYLREFEDIKKAIDRLKALVANAPKCEMNSDNQIPYQETIDFLKEYEEIAFDLSYLFNAEYLSLMFSCNSSGAESLAEDIEEECQGQIEQGE